MALLSGLLLDWLRTARSRRARPFMAVTFLIDGAFIFIFLVAIQNYLPERHGAGVALPGYTLAVYALAKLAPQLLAGRLIDRLGSVRSAELGIGIVTFGQGALIAAVWSPVAVLPAAAVYGVGAAIFWPALYARASNVFEHDERAKLASAMTVTTVFALVAGLSLGLALPGGFPYWAAIALAFVAVLGAAVAAAQLPQPVRAADGREEQPDGGSFRAVVSTALDPRRAGFALIMLGEATAIGGLQAIFRSYGRDWLHVSFREELLYLAPAGLLGAVGVIIGGALADRLGRLPQLGAGFVVAGAAIWALSGITGAEAVVLIAALGGLGAGLALPCVSALSMDLSRTVGQGTLLAWFMTMEGLGHASGSAVGGWLNESFDPPAVLRFVAGLFLAVGVGTVIAWVWARTSTGAALRDGPLAEKLTG